MSRSLPKMAPILVGLACLFGVSSASALDLAMERTGIDTELRAGLNLCLNQGDANCGDWDIGPGVGFGVYGGYRFLPFVAAGLDFGWYTFGNEYSGVLTSTKHLMIEARGYLPLWFLDVYLKVGVGYMTYDIRGKLELVEGEPEMDIDYTNYHPFNVKFGAGATYYLFEIPEWGELGAGLDMDFALINPLKARACSDGDCRTQEHDDDHVNAMQISAHVTWVFPFPRG